MATGNLQINDQCVDCGACLELGYDFIDSSKNGKIFVKPGTFLNPDSSEFKSLQDVCPANAFVFDKTVGKKKVLLNLRDELVNTPGCVKPTKKDLHFDQTEYSVPMPNSSGRSGYEYSSDDAAERAALSEFKSKMYNQIDSLILKVITDYRIKCVRPYYTESKEEGSVYALANEKANTVINGIREILGSMSPASLSPVNIYPNNDIVWKDLKKGILLSDEMISAVRSEFTYDADTYSYNWDTDSMEMIAGRDLFGNTKYKDKYCYQDVYKAYRELAKDLLNCCGYASDVLENRAVDLVAPLVEEYNKALREKINVMVKDLDTVIAQMPNDR